tara:strand:+ start:55 stop:603 length:549 start_codon:yes stop_codon:yes gene_type:complete
MYVVCDKFQHLIEYTTSKIMVHGSKPVLLALECHNINECSTSIEIKDVDSSWVPAFIWLDKNQPEKITEYIDEYGCIVEKMNIISRLPVATCWKYLRRILRKWIEKIDVWCAGDLTRKDALDVFWKMCCLVTWETEEDIKLFIQLSTLLMQPNRFEDPVTERTWCRYLYALERVYASPPLRS